MTGNSMATEGKKTQNNGEPENLEDIISKIKEKEKKKVNIPAKVGIISVAAFVALTGAVGAFSSFSGSENNSAIGKVSTPDTQKVERSLTGKPSSENVKEAGDKAALILNGAKLQEGQTLDGVVSSIEDGDFSVVSESVQKNIHIPENITEEEKETLKKRAYQTVLSLSNIGFKDISTIEVEEDSGSSILSDSEMGTVYVPLTSMKGAPSNPVVFEMVYVDDEWKLAPVSTITQIAIAGQIQSSGGASEYGSEKG